MYLAGLGDNSSVAVPIVGSDRATIGFSPTTMHVDPVSGLPEAQAVAPGTTVVVAAPASSGPSIWLLGALAFGAWYAYEHGWFQKALDALGIKWPEDGE